MNIEGGMKIIRSDPGQDPDNMNKKSQNLNLTSTMPRLKEERIEKETEENLSHLKSLSALKISKMK